MRAFKKILNGEYKGTFKFDMFDKRFAYPTFVVAAGIGLYLWKTNQVSTLKVIPSYRAHSLETYLELLETLLLTHYLLATNSPYFNAMLANSMLISLKLKETSLNSIHSKNSLPEKLNLNHALLKNVRTLEQ